MIAAGKGAAGLCAKVKLKDFMNEDTYQFFSFDFLLDIFCLNGFCQLQIFKNFGQYIMPQSNI